MHDIDGWGVQVQPGVRHGWLRHDARTAKIFEEVRWCDLTMSVAGIAQAVDGGQQRGHHRSLLWVPHGVGGSAASQHCGERRGAHEAHGPEHKPHCDVRHAQHPRGRLPPHPEEDGWRVVRVPVLRPFSRKATPHGHPRRGRWAAPHSETRPTAAAARQVWQPGVFEHRRVAQGRAGGFGGRMFQAEEHVGELLTLKYIDPTYMVHAVAADNLD